MSTGIAGRGLAARRRPARAPNWGCPSEEMPCQCVEALRVKEGQAQRGEKCSGERKKKRKDEERTRILDPYAWMWSRPTRTSRSSKQQVQKNETVHVATVLLPSVPIPILGYPSLGPMGISTEIS